MSCSWCDEIRASTNSVRTCPSCLPVGAIELMIEKDRQIDMFSDPAPLPGLVTECTLDRSGSVSALVEVEVDDDLDRDGGFPNRGKPLPF